MVEQLKRSDAKNDWEKEYKDWLIDVSPDFLWYLVKDVGSYSGSIYAVAKYKNQIAIYEDYYGSCSGCGSWGDGGGEPADQNEVISKSKFFTSIDDAIECVKNYKYFYDAPPKKEMINVIRQIKLNK